MDIDTADVLIDERVDLQLNISLVERYRMWFRLHNVVDEHVQIFLDAKVYLPEKREIPPLSLEFDRLCVVPGCNRNCP